MKVISEMVEAHVFRMRNGRLEFLVIKRSAKDTYPNLWQPVTGRLKKNEIAWKAALREVKEETGLDAIKFWVVPNVNSFYSQYGDYISFIPVFLAEVSSDAPVVLSKEHSEYAWMDAEEAKKMFSWPGQCTSVDIITSWLIGKETALNFLPLKQ